MIELKEVSKIFKSGDKEVTAIDDVSISIEKGEIFGIIGYSGAGKSTLVRTMNGLETVSSGQIRINNNILSDLTKKDLRKARQNIGMIFQHFNILWSRTVRENIMFPLEIAGVSKEDRIKRADELIGLVGLEGREDSYPSKLSGGQKQRVGIARALANDPDVLLCDEATSALDPKTTDDVLNLLLKINQELNLTIVIITHEMDVIRKICDRVAVMDAGKVVEQGTAKEIFNHPKQAITKRFILQNEDENMEESLQDFINSNPDGHIFSIHYGDQTVQQPIISQAIKKFEIDINIIHGSVYTTKASPSGTLYVQAIGDEDAIIAAEDFLSDFAEVEVLYRA